MFVVKDPDRVVSCDYQLFVNGKEQICVVQSAPEYRLGRNICVYRLDFNNITVVN